MPQITINGRQVEVPEGTNVLEACLGSDVPLEHFCYHRYLPVDGNCRTCMVEIETPRGRTLTIGCNTKVAPGMVVHTTSEKAVTAQKSALEFLLLDHPLDCPVCDKAGECKLQDQYQEFGQYDHRRVVPRYFKGGKAVDAGEHIVLDQERCVLCTRCVRFLDQITGTSELGIFHRGHEAVLATFPDRPITTAYSGNVTDVCPVGALTLKEFRFKQRVWLLKKVDSICTRCARGCSITVEHNRDRVWRYMPRENPGLNRAWMCDEGRFSFPDLHTNRLERALLRGQEVGTHEAVAEAARLLLDAAQAGGHSAVVVASPFSSNETLWATRELSKRLFGENRLLAWVPPADGAADDLLRLAARYPNENGMVWLGLNPQRGPWATIGGLAAGPTAPKLVLVVDHDLAGLGGEPAVAWLRSAECVIALASHRTRTVDLATLAIPVRSYAETDGTYVNATSLLQAARRALEPESNVQPASTTLVDLGERARAGTFSVREPAAIFRALAAEHAETKVHTFRSLPGAGVQLGLPPLAPAPFLNRKVDFNIVPVARLAAVRLPTVEARVAP